MDVFPFALTETGLASFDTLWTRGGFPPSFLAPTDEASWQWREHLDILAGTFMVRRLPAWFENLGKRQVKTPKIYFRDSGIYHRLMDITDRAALANHPKLGASWEGMALEQLIRASGASDEQVFFWGVHSQAELDLLMFRDGQRIGYEVKYTDRPRLSKSQHLALKYLRLDRLILVIPGAADYPIEDRIHVRGLNTLIGDAPGRLIEP